MMMNTTVMLGINELADYVVGVHKSAQKNGHSIPVFQFLGQTGIGKTWIVLEIAKRLEME